MINPAQLKKLRAAHAIDAIRYRMKNGSNHTYLRDALLGAIDGGITTFAVVAGAIGGGLSTAVILILGFANLIADGFSMAVSNYLGTKALHDRREEAQRQEALHIDQLPDGQRDEVREAFRQKGFDGEILEQIVDVVTKNRDLWIETVVNDVMKIPAEASSPWRAAVATFTAFLVIGTVPLGPFLVPTWTISTALVVCMVATGIAFFAVGAVKGCLVHRSPLKAGLEVLLTGSGAAVLAYGVGHTLRQLAGGLG